MGGEVNISDAEWLVMNVLWKLNGGTAAEVIEQLAETTDWNHRTIRTLLRRLLEKGFVAREEQPGGSRYLPAVRRSECVRREGKSFLQRVFRGDAASLLMHFAREAKLSSKKLDQLRELLDEEQADDKQ